MWHYFFLLAKILLRILWSNPTMNRRILSTTTLRINGTPGPAIKPLGRRMNTSYWKTKSQPNSNNIKESNIVGELPTLCAHIIAMTAPAMACHGCNRWIIVSSNESELWGYSSSVNRAHRAPRHSIATIKNKNDALVLIVRSAAYSIEKINKCQQCIVNLLFVFVHPSSEFSIPKNKLARTSL